MPELAFNKKARFEYEILDTFTAGLALSSGMVKELRGKRINILGKYIIQQKGKLQIIGFGNDKINENVDILLNKKEMVKVIKELQTKGVTCIILKVFTLKRWIKAEIALVKGKKLYDKRDAIKKRDLDRETDRELKKG